MNFTLERHYVGHTYINMGIGICAHCIVMTADLRINKAEMYNCFMLFPCRGKAYSAMNLYIIMIEYYGYNSMGVIVLSYLISHNDRTTEES